jgi:hypothetical protein
MMDASAGADLGGIPGMEPTPSAPPVADPAGLPLAPTPPDAEAIATRVDTALRNRVSDAALINEFSAMVRAPRFLLSAFEQMKNDRTYISRDAMLQGTQDTVAVNQVLRNQSVMLAYLGVVDPQPFCQPSRQVGGYVNQTGELLSETMEVWLAHHAHLMRFAERIEGAARDASTNAYAIIKCTLQDDLMLDPTGDARFGDMQEQVAEFLRLTELKQSGMLPPNSPEESTLADLDATLRTFAAGKLEEQITAVPVMVPGDVPITDPATGAPIIDPYSGQPVTQPGMVVDPLDPRETKRQAIINGAPLDILGMPQLPHYRGFVTDQVLPDDFRWDWRCSRFEDLVYAEWWANRVYMSPKNLQRKFRLTSEAMKKIVGAQAGSQPVATSANTDRSPTERDQVEQQTLNDRVAVWELWHAGQRRRYVFCEGCDYFLANETPQAVGRRFSPFFTVGFNTVTGQMQPISDVQLSRSLQDQINQTLSHDREYRRGAYPVLFIPKGLLDKAAIEEYRRRTPFSIIEANNPEEISKFLQESATVPYNPELCDVSKPESMLQSMFGIPMVVTGGESGESLASSVALAKEGMETGVLRRRVQINRVITEMFEWMAEISLKAFSLKDVQAVCGPAAVWPRLTADQLYTNIRIEIKGGLTGQPRAKERIDLWMNFATIAQSLGLPLNGVEVLRELLDSLGIRVDFKRFLMPVQIPGTMPGMGAPGAPAASGGPAKPANRGAGPDGGAPTMVERGAPSDLSQIPNHPPSVPAAA